MQTLGEKTRQEENILENQILKEKEILYEKPKRKKFFDSRRKMQLKKLGNTLFVVLFLAFVCYFILVCISTDYSDDKIYDEYKELDDKELAFIVKKQMKDLTISRNVNVNFVIIYKDVYLPDFLSDKIDEEKNVTVIYNPVEKTLNLYSDLDYLIEDYKWEDIKDVKKELPKYFSMIEKKLEKNVCIADFHTITFNIIASKELVVVLLLAIIFGVGIIYILRL